MFCYLATNSMTMGNFKFRVMKKGTYAPSFAK